MFDESIKWYKYMRFRRKTDSKAHERRPSHRRARLTCETVPSLRLYSMTDAESRTDRVQITSRSTTLQLADDSNPRFSIWLTSVDQKADDVNMIPSALQESCRIREQDQVETTSWRKSSRITEFIFWISSWVTSFCEDWHPDTHRDLPLHSPLRSTSDRWIRTSWNLNDRRMEERYRTILIL